MSENDSLSHSPTAWVSCQHSIDRLVEYLDGTLPPEEMARLDRHFAVCPPCIDFVRKYRATTPLCRKALVEELPEETADRLHDFLAARLKP